MKNVTITEENGMLVIRIDPSKKFGRSASGKTYIVASTGKAEHIGDTPDGLPIFLGLNAYHYPPRS